MNAKAKKTKSYSGVGTAPVVIVVCLIIAICIFKYVLGNPDNFMNGDPNGHPLPGNMLGTIYKGGVVVPLIQTLLLTVIALSVERWFALSKAKGKGNITRFVVNIKEALSENNIAKARELCNKQKGSVANVVYAALEKYDEMEKDNELSKEQKEQVEKKLLETTESPGRSYRTGAAHAGTEPAGCRHPHHAGYPDGTSGNGYRYDQVVRRTGQRRFA